MHKNMEDLLQERLEQLEAGQPLNECTAGVPAEIAEALQMAAMLREMAYPARDAATVQAQRSELVALATGTNGRPAGAAALAAATLATATAWLDRLKAWFRARSGFDKMMMALLAPAIFLLLCGGIVSLFSIGSGQETAVVEDAAAPTEMVADSTDPSVEAPAAGVPTPTLAAESAAATPPAESPTAEAVAAAPEVPDNTAYLPFAPNPLELDPATAELKPVAGVVEVQQADGSWSAVSYATAVNAGQRVRTGPFSSATLSFFDGSQATLSAESELSVDELDAQRPAEGFRTVVLTQWQGESEHAVAFRNDGGSRYEVKTPDSTGIARGTLFRVSVTPGLAARYIVLEGRVDVTSISVTVAVIAGQITTIPIGQVPAEPTFLVTGEGEVAQTGAEWVVGGQTFQTDDATVIVGNPQVGDWVRVEGYLAADGSRVASRIILLRRTIAQQFTLTGEVESIGDTSWTVAGQTIAISSTTTLVGTIAEGDTVRVSGTIAAGGELVAETIALVETATPGLPFSFVGVVQAIAADTWTVSGTTLVIDAETAVEAGLAVGDTVTVQGFITAGDVWLARSIELFEDDAASFVFQGTVQSSDPWQVAGIGFETRPWTVIAPDVAVGDEVIVRGFITADGTWVATQIEPVTAVPLNTIVIIGTLTSIDPWIVNGIPFELGSGVVLVDAQPGILVRVVLQPLPTGSWVAIAIQPADVVLACFTVNTTVVSISGDQVVLDGWPTITLADVAIDGTLTPNSIISFYGCFNGGAIVFIEQIIVLVDITVVAPTLPPATGGDTLICHRPPGNPGNASTLSVGPGAVASHLAHGDTLGPCGGGGGGDDDDDGGGRGRGRGDDDDDDDD